MERVEPLLSSDTPETDWPQGAVPYRYWAVRTNGIESVEGGLIEEMTLSLFVNGQDLATLMCSPLDQEALALGFLFNEGVIAGLDDVRLVRPNATRATVDVFLNRSEFAPPRRFVLTSGCGGGISFRDMAEQFPPLASTFETTPDALLARMRDLQSAAQLYQSVRGVHTAVLVTPERLLLSAEDIGRHNTIDKLAGKALQQGIVTRDTLLLTSGRISSEMVTKARHMQVPIVASRTAPTSITVQLAAAWNICVVGYVRQGQMRVYTHPERLGLPPL